MKATGHSIKSLLGQRNAALKGPGGDQKLAQKRQELTKHIQRNYDDFEILRDQLLQKKPSPVPQSDFAIDFCNILHERGMLAKVSEGVVVKKPEVKRYLSGGWLEELAWLAALEAGVDEAIFSQSLAWSAAGYHGENEIDLLMRQGERLAFASCKALKSSFVTEDRKHRNRLMEALHEADNMADHFGIPGEQVAVIVTTDLIDEMKGQPRYMALMGKAAVLDVRIIPLEELGWNDLVSAIGGLFD